MSRHIIVSDEARKKLEKIKLMRPQDTSMAQTIDHLIYVYEGSKQIKVLGQPMNLKEPGSASPIIDADKLQNVRK